MKFIYNRVEWEADAILCRDGDGYRGYSCVLIDVILNGIRMYEHLRDEVIESMEECVIDAYIDSLSQQEVGVMPT